MKVTLVGAGVAGLACATELMDRGLRVRIVERRAEPARGCSRLAGGMLAPHCERADANQEVARLGASSADWWARHTEGVVRRGTLVLGSGHDRSELERFAARTHGFERVGPEEIGHLEPALAGRFEKGLFFADEAHLEPRVALEELRAAVVNRGGEIESSKDGDDLLRRFGGSSEAGEYIVDCRGYEARHQVSELRGVRGEMIVVRSAEIELSRPVRLLHPRFPMYIVPRENGVHMIGATMLESDDARGMTIRSALELLGAAYNLHPAFGEAELLETGAGIRPALDNNLPRVMREGRVFRVNGLFRHGFLLAPAMASELSNQILGMHNEV